MKNEHFFFSIFKQQAKHFHLGQYSLYRTHFKTVFESLGANEQKQIADIQNGAIQYLLRNNKSTQQTPDYLAGQEAMQALEKSKNKLPILFIKHYLYHTLKLNGQTSLSKNVKPTIKHELLYHAKHLAICDYIVNFDIVNLHTAHSSIKEKTLSLEPNKTASSPVQKIAQNSHQKKPALATPTERKILTDIKNTLLSTLENPVKKKIKATAATYIPTTAKKLRKKSTRKNKKKSARNCSRKMLATLNTLEKQSNERLEAFGYLNKKSQGASPPGDPITKRETPTGRFQTTAGPAYRIQGHPAQRSNNISRQSLVQATVISSYQSISHVYFFAPIEQPKKFILTNNNKPPIWR